MNETHDRVHRELDEMFRRREMDVAGPTRLPKAARRHARRRQVGTVTVAAMLVFAVAGALVLVPRPDVEQPAVPQAPPRTSTIDGVTITYPSDWYLVALPQITLNQDAVAFRPVLQLSNFDPIGEGRRWFCPVSVGGRIPDDGILLYLEAVDRDTMQDVPAWPVPPPIAPLTGPVETFGACGSSDDPQAAWAADGVPYHASVLGDATDERLQDAFTSMRFEGGTRPRPREVDVGALDREAYVIGSGTSGADPWNLYATPPPDPCLAMATNGEQVRWVCDAWQGLDASRPIDVRVGLGGGANEHTHFGGVDPRVTTIEDWIDDGTTRSVSVVELPSAFQGLRAFATSRLPHLGGVLAVRGGASALIRYADTDFADVQQHVVLSGGNDWYAFDMVAFPRPAGTLQVVAYALPNGASIAPFFVGEAAFAAEGGDDAILQADALNLSAVGQPPTTGSTRSVLTFALLPVGTRYVERVFETGATIRSDREDTPHLFTSLEALGIQGELYAATDEGSDVTGVIEVRALDGELRELATVTIEVR